MLKAIGRALARVWRRPSSGLSYTGFQDQRETHRFRDERAAGEGMWDGHSGPGI
jgi:hypothetical protein